MREDLCRRARGWVLWAFMLGLAVALAACSRGFASADVEGVKQDMHASFARQGLKVTEYSLSRDSAYQISGTITVQMETPMGLRSFVTSCVATMDPATRKTSWRCDQIAPLR